MADGKAILTAFTFSRDFPKEGKRFFMCLKWTTWLEKLTRCKSRPAVKAKGV